MAESIGSMFAERGRVFSQRTALRRRAGTRFEDISYGALLTLVRQFGSGLISLGIKSGDSVFVLSDNRYEWLVADLAIVSVGAVNISRGGDSTPSEIEYIINHSRPRVLIVENHQQLEKIASLKENLPAVALVILFEGEGKGDGRLCTYSFQNVLTRGNDLTEKGDNRFDAGLAGVRKDDLAAIVYTSGTTGPPKGVMLTHRNILSNIEATLKVIKITAEDRFLSILPSWHMFERIAEYIVLDRGASFVYTNARAIRFDMISQKPTYIVCVPRIWETFYERISKRFKESPAGTRAIITVLLKLGKVYAYSGRILRREDLCFAERGRLENFLGLLKACIVRVALKPAHWAGDVMIYKKVKQATGGCLKTAISGGGSFPPSLDDFFEIVGIEVINGYGLTETSPVVAARTLDHNVRGTVGRPIPGTEIKLVDEKGNEAHGGKQGIVMVRGPQVMQGYYKDKKATAAVMKDGGWFDTGDLGKITVEGDLVITGRAKDTIVLLGGENVEPEPIEIVLKESEYIENVMIVGQDKKYLAALIRPNIQMLSEYLAKQGLDVDDALKNPLADELIKTEIASRVNETKGFKLHERIVKFRIIVEDWTRENGLLTPTLKLKRNVIAERYRDLVEKIYE